MWAPRLAAIIAATSSYADATAQAIQVPLLWKETDKQPGKGTFALQPDLADMSHVKLMTFCVLYIFLFYLFPVKHDPYLFVTF